MFVLALEHSKLNDPRRHLKVRIFRPHPILNQLLVCLGVQDVDVAQVDAGTLLWNENGNTFKPENYQIHLLSTHSNFALGLW